jgi:ethanolamine transporter EutH
MMQKRVGLGLADPIVSNRFGLWSIWMGGLTLMLGIVLVLRLLGLFFGLEPSMMSIILPQVLPLLRLLLASVALVAGTAVWLTFFPPRFYARRLQRSAG